MSDIVSMARHQYKRLGLELVSDALGRPCRSSLACCGLSS